MDRTGSAGGDVTFQIVANSDCDSTRSRLVSGEGGLIPAAGEISIRSRSVAQLKNRLNVASRRLAWIGAPRSTILSIKFRTSAFVIESMRRVPHAGSRSFLIARLFSFAPRFADCSRRNHSSMVSAKVIVFFFVGDLPIARSDNNVSAFDRASFKPTFG